MKWESKHVFGFMANELYLGSHWTFGWPEFIAKWWKVKWSVELNTYTRTRTCTQQPLYTLTMCFQCDVSMLSEFRFWFTVRNRLFWFYLWQLRANVSARHFRWFMANVLWKSMRESISRTIPTIPWFLFLPRIALSAIELHATVKPKVFYVKFSLSNCICRRLRPYFRSISNTKFSWFLPFFLIFSSILNGFQLELRNGMFYAYEMFSLWQWFFLNWTETEKHWILTHNWNTKNEQNIYAFLSSFFVFYFFSYGLRLDWLERFALDWIAWNCFELIWIAW